MAGVDGSIQSPATLHKVSYAVATADAALSAVNLFK